MRQLTEAEGLFWNKGKWGWLSMAKQWTGIISVKNGVLQGSILASVMFIILTNDMTKGINSYVYLLADDTKLLKAVKNTKKLRYCNMMSIRQQSGVKK